MILGVRALFKKDPLSACASGELSLSKIAMNPSDASLQFISAFTTRSDASLQSFSMEKKRARLIVNPLNPLVWEKKGVCCTRVDHMSSVNHLLSKKIERVP